MGRWVRWALLAAAATFASCSAQASAQPDPAKSRRLEEAAGNASPGTGIAPVEIEDAQQRWADAMLHAATLHQDGSGGWREVAEQYVDSDMGFQQGPVLLRPESTSDGSIRTTRSGVLSYLVGQSEEFPGDTGFWLDAWTDVRFENAGIISQGAEGLVNGRCYMKKSNGGNEAKLDYSFGFFRDVNNSLRLNMLFLALPYDGRNQTKYAGITQDDVISAQKSWGDAILEIGHAHSSGQDYRQRAEDFVDTAYGFGVNTVWFKPTEALEKPFRSTREGAISYFVAGSEEFPEDNGFALWSWSSIHFDNAGYILEADRAWAIGTATFQDSDGALTIAQYAFGYTRDVEGNLRINLHHSAKPMNGDVGHGSWELVDDSPVLASLEDAQSAWATAIVRIGTLHSISRNYESAGAAFVDGLYAFSIRPVLFRPAELEVNLYRHTRDGAISYFVGGDDRYPEDDGFALAEWRSVHFSNVGMLFQGDESIAMGTFAFQGRGGVETTADYVFGYVPDSSGQLRINLFQTSYPEQVKSEARAPVPITADDVHQAQQRWADGIVNIGETYTNSSDYVTRAERFVDDLYAYDTIPVLLRVTDSHRGHIRRTREGAISYFVGKGDEVSTSDAGLALQPWASVRFENAGSNIVDERAEVVGHCVLTDAHGTEHTMEYTFVYWRARDGTLRIILNFLSWPYDAEDGWWLTEAVDGAEAAAETAAEIGRGPVGLALTICLLGCCFVAVSATVCRKHKTGSGWHRPDTPQEDSVELAPLMSHGEAPYHHLAPRYLPVQASSHSLMPAHQTQLSSAYVVSSTGLPSSVAVPYRVG